ncbi:MAG: PAS domain S-box protein [Acidobacteriia bacterium]|nr:PAS domain S-box protein [Terriglobia bacterium]
MTKAKILIVEDDSVVGVYIQKCLEKAGFVVVAVVSSAEQAVAAARSETPDLALMDITLPGDMDGVEAARQIRFQLNIPVVYLTGSADEKTLERAKVAEPLGYLLKPFNERELQTTIESALHQYHASTMRTQETLRQAEEKYHAMFENLPVGIYRTTPAGQMLTANPAMAHILGYETPAELIAAASDVGSSVYAKPEHRRELLGVLGQYGIVRNFETRLRRRSGDQIWVSISARAVKDTDGRDLCYEGSIQDITERKRAEDALRESEARLTCVVNSAQDGIVMMDDEGLVTLWSPAAERITGYTAEEIVGRNLHDLIAPARLRDKHHSALQSWRESGQGNAIGQTSEVPCLRKDGAEIITELSLSSVRLRGRWTAVGIIRDIAERKRAQKERDRMEVMLRQSQKLESVGQLAAGIAHEINTPTQYVGDNTRFLKDAFGDLQSALQAYWGLLAACKEGNVTPELVQEVESGVQAADVEYLSEEIPKAIGQTLEGVDRVATIVRAMKDFSHPGTREKTPTNIHKAIESTLIVCRHEYKYVAEVVTDFDSSMPLVPCFPGDFNQVILNLVINAAHAIADRLGSEPQSKGKITVKTVRDGNGAEIRVSDTGTGIPESARPRIFDPFFTTKEVGKGTGQGLAICHAVVVGKHGGMITFETEIGKGTTFIVRLPLD